MEIFITEWKMGKRKTFIPGRVIKSNRFPPAYVYVYKNNETIAKEPKRKNIYTDPTNEGKMENAVNNTNGILLAIQRKTSGDQ